jgi:hypothetical protein
MPVRYL